MSSRRLSAIMFTDIVGYTALMGSDEDKAFDMLKQNHAIHEELITKCNGKLIKEIGDGTLASFNLASDAVRCAMEIQKTCKEQDIPLKIGIHEGEMVFAGADVLGDGVNIASRLQEESHEGCITISGRVYSDIKNKAGINTKYMGEKRLKNVDELIKVYEVFLEVDKGKSDSRQKAERKNKRPYYIIFGLLAIIGAILIWKFIPGLIDNAPETKAVTDKSIAVLPFRNDSPDQENEYFCNGMLEEILTHLQKIEDMDVKSRTTSEQYRDVAKDLTEIASELDVAFLLEGSVRKAGDDIRITAQLIDGASGDHLWAETYDGKYTDKIFDFQSEIARKIASSLNAIITPVEMKRIEGQKPNEIMAFDMVLRGIDEMDKYSDSKDLKYIKSALTAFDKAIEIDPGYTGGYAQKGNLYNVIGTNDSVHYYAKKSIEMDAESSGGYMLMGQYYMRTGKADLAIEYFLKALEIAPNNNWINFELGFIYLNQKNDIVRGFKYMNEAIKKGINEMQDIYGFIGATFANIGDFEKAEEYYLNSLTLRAGCGWLEYYSRLLLNNGKPEECLQFLDSICIISDCERSCGRIKYYAYLYKKDFQSAEDYLNLFFQNGYVLLYTDSISLAYIYQETGRENEALSILEQLRSTLENQLKQKENLFLSVQLFRIYALRDEEAKALECLETVVKRSPKFPMWLYYLMGDPVSEKKIYKPEFQSLLKPILEENIAARAQINEMRARGEIDL